jgi:hypothetical protein
MLSLLLNKEKLNDLFKNVSNPFQALEIKNNIEECLSSLKVPSSELIEMLNKEGINPESFNTPSVEIVEIKKERKVNLETRSFLIENDIPVKILSGRAVSSEISKGSTVLKYSEMTEDQKELSKKLIIKTNLKNF